MFHEFVKQKIIEYPNKFWEKTSKVNTPTFETLNKVMTVPISKDKDKVIKYDKDLCQRFLAVPGSRKIDLQDVLSYQLCPVPLSIAQLNGSMRKAAKSNLLKELMIDINIPDHLPDHDLSSIIYLNDLMVLVQLIQKEESKTFGDLTKVIAESVTSSSSFRSKIVLCPDRYDTEYSIKSFEREKRATASSRERVIYTERTPNFKEFLMNAKNKVSFISFVLNLLVSAFCPKKSSSSDCRSFLLLIAQAIQLLAELSSFHLIRTSL